MKFIHEKIIDIARTLVVECTKIKTIFDNHE